jgi:diguanylate cyclase (GGDEF)-like protein/PAS domain S-box-containing protein
VAGQLIFKYIRTINSRNIYSFLLLTILAITGNFIRLPIYIGVDLIWGSIFVLITTACLGYRWGLLNAILSGLVTLTFWSSPYFIVLSVLEVTLVSYLLKKKDNNLLLIDGVFWYIVGLPLGIVYYYFFQNLDLELTYLKVLKQVVNGITNALIASILINHLPIRNWINPTFQRYLSIQQFTSNFLTAFVLMTALFASIAYSHTELKNNNREIVKFIKHETGQIKKQLLYIKKIHPTNSDEKRLILDIFSASKYGNYIEQVALIDKSKGKVILSYAKNGSQPIFKEKLKDKHIEPIQEGIYVYFPFVEEELSETYQWTNSYYVQEVPIEKDKNVTLQLIISAKPYHLLIQKTLISNFSILITFILIIFISISVLNRKIILPISELSNLTYNLPEKITKKLPITWPNSSLEEINSLIANFSWMAKNLDIAFTENNGEISFRQKLIDTIPSPIFYKDIQGRYIGCNKAFEEYLGTNREELYGKSVFDLSPPELAQKYYEMDQALFDNPGTQVYESSVKYADSSVHDVIFYKATFDDDDGKVAGMIGVFVDITDRKRVESVVSSKQLVLKRQLNFAKALYKITSSVIKEDNTDQILTFLAQILGETLRIDRVKILEVKIDEGIIKTLSRWDSLEFEELTNSPDQYPLDDFGYSISNLYNEKIWIESHKDRINEFVIKDKQDGYLHEILQIKSLLWLPFSITDNNMMILVFDQLSSQRNWEPDEINFINLASQQVEIATQKSSLLEQMTHLAQHDSLTNLLNRSFFYQRMETAIKDAKLSASKGAVIFLDLDRFKLINDTMGHAIGDKLLKNVAIKLQEFLPEVETISRLGGDEFTILLPSIDNEAEAALIAQKVIDIFQEPWLIEGQDYNVTTSIGIAIYPNDGQDVETLMKHADTAMYKAKEQGRNKYQFFTSLLNSKVMERVEMEKSLRLALKNEDFIIHYQPQVDIIKGEIVGCEALIRWNHPKHGTIGPNQFIPLAEETGLILPIGDWVLAKVCGQTKAWNDLGLKHLKSSVNISASQFLQKDFVKSVAGIIADTGLNPSHLSLEITESVAMYDVELTKKVLSELQAMGISIAIDDFGTGYSCLNYLKRFPINTLKIDRSFVCDLPDDNDGKAIVASIIGLATNLNLNVIAEGVETKEQMLFLKGHNCSNIQGYLFSKPLSTEEFTELLILNNDSKHIFKQIII